MQLPLQNFRKNVHKSLIHMEAASPKMRNRHFGVELGRSRADQEVPVLIVDDSAAVRAHLSVVLQSYGYVVTAAESGEAGVVAAGSLDYACVLMDVLMPGMDGYDACRRIKAMRQQGKRPPPIVMLTSRSSPFDRIRGKMAGCDAYLTKPVEKSYLLEILAQHVHKNGVVSAT